LSSSSTALQTGETKSKVCLLVVEDNSADVWLLKEAIQFYKVPVDLYLVQDGEAAVRFIEEAGTNPDAPCPELVLLDLNLPKKTGREVLRYLKASQRYRQIPVIVMTSSDSPKDRMDVVSLGATRFFRKPADYESFLEIGNTLNQVLRERL
jgi:two-component system, chemotaxis family, response regulator Rcp1